MRLDPKRHQRRSIRLPGYDYTQAGAYFITIVTQGRECQFGQVVNGEMRLNDAGRMIWDEWKALARRFPAIELDEFAVMPNHFHGIVWIVGTSLVDADDGAITRGATTRGATTRVAPTLVGIGIEGGTQPNDRLLRGTPFATKQSRAGQCEDCWVAALRSQQTRKDTARRIPTDRHTPSGAASACVSCQLLVYYDLSDITPYHAADEGVQP